jgi:perosamine synthetase
LDNGGHWCKATKMKLRNSDDPIAPAMAERDALRDPTIPDPDPIVMPCAAVPSDSAHQASFIPVSDTALEGNELRYLTECISSNWISSAGSFVARFEDAFAAAVGCEFGVACSTGTAALHLALAAVGIGPGDEVIIPTFTMIAVANAVEYTGAHAVLVDAEPLSWNLDPSLVEVKIGPKTKAIIAAHTYGCPADMLALRALAAARSLVLIEDAAEAHGAQCDRMPAGSLGRVAAFSFYANKIITTGEGGMVTTNDRPIADKARKLRGHAFSDERHFWHEMVGFNYRMTNLQAAVGLAQTERLVQLVERRLENARRYSAALSGIRGLTLPPDPPGRRNVFWMYSILVEEEFGCSRDELRGYLAARGIETRTFFIPIHLQPIYRDRYQGQSYPIAEALCRKGLYLPSGPGLSMGSIEFIAREIARVASRPQQSK